MSVGTPASSAGSTEFVRSEVLYFIQNKCALLPFDSVVSICSDFYTCNEIESARALIAEHLAPTRRITKHNGTEDVKRKKTTHDLVKICLDPAVHLPTFFSTDMTRIPAVGAQHVDVSMLLQEVSALRAEVRSMAQIRTESADIGHVLSASRSGEVAATNDVCATAEVEAADSISFAATARMLQHGGMKEKPVVKAKKPPLVDRAANSKLKTVVTMRDIDLFVSRLHPSTQITELHDCVTDILGERYGDKTDCTKLQSRYEALYSSYHVRVKVSVSEFANALELLNVAESWPDGALVRRHFKPKNGQ